VTLLGFAAWLAPLAPPPASANGAAQADAMPSEAIGYKTVQAVLEQRCYLCHGALVQMKNVRLDSPEAVQTHARNLYQQAVVARNMPFNNATHITDAERALIGKWFTDGASVR
jgi:uncharacterized membrane protein